MNRRSIIMLCLLATVIAGCASARPTQFYTLSPSAAQTAATASYSISVGPVSVPAVVDRSQIVLQMGPNQVFISEFDRWAAPLKQDIARIVAENLASILGASQSTVFPQLTTAEVSYRVVIDVLRFESVPDKAAILDARWTVNSRKNGRSVSNRAKITEPAQGGGYAELVAAHSRALAGVSGKIAETIREMEGQKR